MTTSTHQADSTTQVIAEREGRFRALIMATADIVYAMNADWTVMQQLDGRGFLSDNLEPNTDWLRKYILQEDQEAVKTAIAEAVANKQMFRLEHRVIRSDGTPGWALSRAVPILNEKNEIIEWFGAATDITPLRESKEQAEQQKRLYETINSSTPDLIYVFSLDYRFTYVNQALLTMWGKTWDTAVGKGLRENGYEEWHAQMHEREIDQVRAMKKPVRGEVSFPHAVLGRRVYDYILTPVLDKNGEVEAVAGTTRDVTERKTFEQELQSLNEELTVVNEEMASANEELIATNEELAQSEFRSRQMVEQLQNADEHSAKLAAIVESSDDAIIGKNLDGIITSWNRGAERIFGYKESDIIGQPILRLIPEDLKHEEPEILSRLRKGEKIDHYETIRQTADGRLIPVSLTISPIRDKEGRVIGVSKIARDISEQKRDEQRKSDFIGMASHELKTPLTSLSALMQILQHKVKDNADPFLPHALAKATQQIKRMSSLINGFLNVSRLESGKLEIMPEPFDLSELAAEEAEEIRLTAADHMLILNCHLAVNVLADRQKIGSVISNLLSNAVKYSAKGTHITVTCTAENGQAILSVEDEGTGISPYDLSRIFDRYYRATNEQTKNIAGFGVGLYLSSEIIQRHDGKIWATSERGVGSTFSFSLPLCQ
ncbi:PAS domain-containing sensor histidine kinase [Mucilaginibacter sp. SJ]|uniref:PAS domain-containing sensor histidine kinase n=1 Tax=Mucilaginibacter sp. SJ TaxID=3029053 RepID=UPI0023A9D38C|nr:PAS domain S-box protein [Mucilaginibacter sp. SJ]WEA01664.1 PAS domain S-box protein [Mucilaginibacter sp. SJ]